MKLIIATLLALTALAAADISCDLCKNHYQYCLDNGVVPGIDKEAQICAEHVCFQNPECRRCGDELGKCPDNSCYHKGCGNHDCAP
ncbi:hypothetical protein HBI56_139970 [Parastagonospora nodorum]|uniref:Uncharacterized protein n=1 Tax=Phaeosphaeria nodorum (strain SN15 / ATCC MYA-4574 / FGSC 10173) TaxID=321614 RepID=A0A7U2NPH2_PHANO|nr:hypothetical protein HBH56_127820 [Parastagonospora nodorum]QRD05714.1 hypothetical protein JI435_444800 [Parastagonospora nodorum SN15]KAH3931333.1 hypothetical protein HBH54_095660 [Parastagonospora nodorum]KAH3947386.1 hypothetical protein HBH53_118110 [Parastagonospora nodorum]KAH3970631.1 hypothetical protein HBH51_114540 [Parastagonospora nodorum]